MIMITLILLNVTDFDYDYITQTSITVWAGLVSGHVQQNYLLYWLRILVGHILMDHSGTLRDRNPLSNFSIWKNNHESLVSTDVSSHDSAVSYSVGLVWGSGNCNAVVWQLVHSSIKRKSWRDMMGMCLSNSAPIMTVHVVCSLGVEICAGLEQVWVRDNNTVKRVRAVI